MTGWASSKPQNATSMARSGDERVSSCSASSTGPVDAQPHVALARRHHAAEAGAEAARHARLERELGRDRRARRTARGPPRASPAARRRRPRVGVALELGLEQIGHQAVVPDAAVVGRQLRRLGSSARPGGVRARRGSRAATGAVPRPGWSCQIASGAIPTPPPTSSGRRPSRAAREAAARAARRAAAPRRLASSHSRLVPGPDVLEQEVQLAVRPAGRAQDAEGARQKRPLALPPPHRSRRAACRTARRCGRGPVGVGAAQHDVGAVLLAPGHRARAAAERRRDRARRPRSRRAGRATGAGAWIS